MPQTKSRAGLGQDFRGVEQIPLFTIFLDLASF